MQLFKSIGLLLFCGVLSVQASESITLPSKTGDTLMIHRLNNGEIWGSLMITDHVSDSFADYELIVLQVDQNKPIKLDQEKRCGTPAGEAQKVSYSFETEDSNQWQFSQEATAKPDILKLTGWDKDIYQHMKSDRRPEVVDFPIKATIAIESLWQQFQQGNSVTFRYTTDADETRQALFELNNKREQIKALIQQ
ncbi:MAG: hypothetical protein PSN44_08050 [Gammaproteobacteria bacterium]|nr:hypothetical protein [Gammaproteobacteria bacterium]